MPHWLVNVSNYLPLEPLAQSMQTALSDDLGHGLHLAHLRRAGDLGGGRHSWSRDGPSPGSRYAANLDIGLPRFHSIANTGLVGYAVWI